MLTNTYFLYVKTMNTKVIFFFCKFLPKVCEPKFKDKHLEVNLERGLIMVSSCITRLAPIIMSYILQVKKRNESSR